MLEFLDFIRVKICIFCVFIGISGFLIFNKMSINLLFVILGIFSLCASVCAYNNIIDKEEDNINKRMISYLIFTKKGYFIISLFFISGLLSTLILSKISIIIYLISSFLGFIYSIFKFKKYLLLKNFYSAFSWSLSFLFGASIIFSYNSIIYYIIISLFIFVSSILSDLRDFKGDKIRKIKTVPVTIGYIKCKKTICLLYIFFTIFILLGRFNEFLIFIPFCLFIIIFVNKDKIELAHDFSGFAFITFALHLLI